MLSKANSTNKINNTTLRPMSQRLATYCYLIGQYAALTTRVMLRTAVRNAALCAYECLD